jgi:K+-sensing histidine kinase KdpD
MADSFEQQLASLPTLDRNNLNQLWHQLFKTMPRPRMRKTVMLRFLAYRIQEQAYGGLSHRSQQRIREFALALAANPKAELSSVQKIRAGTRLVRQWRDQVHVVHVEEQFYEYGGVRYDSLSEIARLITGTRWSGPLFFGLKQNKQNQEATRDGA